MTPPVRVAVLGAGGFVGASVVEQLSQLPGVVAVAVPAPRLRSHATTAAQLRAEATASRPRDGGTAADSIARLAGALAGAAVVVNAAGDPDASGLDLPRLVGANALMPLVALLAAERAGVGRFVHVSSAVVQGRAACLDESQLRDPFSPYALSKCLGEEAVLGAATTTRPVVYRPPSVHSGDRRVTRGIARVAGSPLRSVAGAGDRPTPQALLVNVGAAVARLCVAEDPPPVVMHPWEGLTTGGLMRLLGGRRPHRIPEPLARGLLLAARATLGRLPGRAADVRRVEMLWFGQRQAQSWLTGHGWRPPVGEKGWRHLADQVRRGADRANEQGSEMRLGASTRT